MCMNNSMCGCSSNNNVCENFGPFLAVDAACITNPPAATVGSIIPFSSGITPVELTILANGLVGTGSLVGFGTAVPGVTIGNTIDITTDILAGVFTEAFSVPRAGTITSISASLTTLATVAIFGPVTVRAQIYRAVAGSNVFSPTTAFVDLAPPLASIALGTITFNTRNVTPVPVAPGDLLLMVFSATIAGTGTAIVTVTGAASAGINIV
ncbi:exosporium glycoprotein BclB-related protein [Lysinibacillus xylanilyticus]|uniref:exosporium glycoprotein BclB-related protein n=1 Tax=Lysinibacillus xylanilyticus TaxID=582475 RepID=UPI0037F9A217